MATQKLYSFKDHPEHERELGAWAQKWIANALNCTPMDDADRAAMVTAMDGMYRAANLEPPTRHIFVGSPMTGAIAASIASAAWWIRDTPAAARELFKCDISEDDIIAGIHLACRFAVAHGMARCLGVEPPKVDLLPSSFAASLTYAATYAATDAATYAATDAATRAATYAATYAATDAATRAATYAATYAATRAATYAATEQGVHDVAYFMLMCLQRWDRFWAGGNQWSFWDSYTTFFRHVAKLPLDYSKYEHWEKAAIHAGPRFMHQKFWIVSDRPEFIHRDDQARPHRLDGPFTRWRDGWELHAIAGINVPERITAGRFGVRDIQSEMNAEVRRVMITRYEGEDRGKYLRDAGAKVVDSDVDMLGHPRRLLRMEIQNDEPYVAVEVMNSTLEPDGTRKRYTLRVPPTMKTCQEAVAWTFGVEPTKYAPRVET